MVSVRLALPRLVAAALIAACGRLGFDAVDGAGGDGGTGDGAGGDVDGASGGLAGLWVVESALVRGEAGERARDDLVSGIRADLRIGDRSPDSADWRILSLSGGLGSDIDLGFGEVETSPDTWIFSGESGENLVYKVRGEGDDRFHFEHDPTDERNIGDAYLIRGVIVRGPTFEPALAGSWRLVEVHFPGQDPVEAGACVAIGGGLYERITGLFEMTRTLMMTYSMSYERFSDPSCVTEVETREDLALAYSEVGMDRVVQQWIFHPDGDRGFVGGTLEIEDDRRRMVRESCAPLPECEQYALSIEFEAAP